MNGGTESLGTKEEQPSSTPIRLILANVNDDIALIKTLTGIALSPSLLFHFLQQLKAQE